MSKMPGKIDYRRELVYLRSRQAEGVANVVRR
jgi:hypothetical protein